MQTSQREVQNAGRGYPASVRLDGSEIGSLNKHGYARIATVVIATTVHPKRELGWPKESQRESAHNPSWRAVDIERQSGPM
jgi:hypothetical protein